MTKLEELGVRSNVHEISFGRNGNILELAMMVAQLCEYTKNLYTLKGQILQYLKYIYIYFKGSCLPFIFLFHCSHCLKGRQT